jgi:HSP20 family protein
MPASDGKYYLTDTADKGTLHEILYLISPESLPQLKRYLESLEEVTEDSSNSGSSNLSSENSASEGYPQEEHSSPENSEKREENDLHIDAYRDGDFIVIRTCAEGIEPESIFISATCKHLSIKGVRNNSIEDPHAASHFHQELRWGAFHRRFELPHEVDIHKVEAISRNGLIVIRLPIIDKEYSRRIKIKNS